MKTPKVPTYGHHKPTGQARCYVSGKSVYLGKYGSVESRILYGEIVAKVVSGRPVDPFVTKSADPASGLTVNELVLAFLRHVDTHYVKNGKPTSEIHCLRAANVSKSAVDDMRIETVKKLVRPLVCDLIDLQRLSGARSGELLKLTTGMIDRTGDVWRADILACCCGVCPEWSFRSTGLPIAGPELVAETWCDLFCPGNSEVPSTPPFEHISQGFSLGPDLIQTWSPLGSGLAGTGTFRLPKSFVDR